MESFPRIDEFHRLGKDDLEELRSKPAMERATADIEKNFVEKNFTQDVKQPQEIKKAEPVQKRDYKALAIKPIALGISLCASGMSIYYSFKWFESKMPVLLAMVMSITIVTCLTLLPDVAILFFRRKKISSILGGIFLLIIAVTSAMFSMSSTIGGLYDARSTSLKEVKTEDVKTAQVKAESSRLEAARDRTLESLARYRKDEESLQKQYDTWASRAAEGEATSNNAIITQLNATRARIDNAEKELSDIEARISELEATEFSAVVVRDDFYTWISARFSSSEETVEFIFSAFPAIFIDIIAPAMLAIVLFL